MTKKNTDSTPAKDKTTDAAPAEETEVASSAAETADAASGVVGAGGVIDMTATAEVAKQQAAAEVAAEDAETIEAAAQAEADAKLAQMVEVLKREKRAEFNAQKKEELTSKKSLDLQKEAEAQADKELSAEFIAKALESTDETWKEDKNANITRVFRSSVFKGGNAVRSGLVVLNRDEGLVEGTKVKAQTIVVDPNHADQYVLKKGAVDYAKQLEAYRTFEKLKKVREVAPRFEGMPFVPEIEQQIRKKQAELDSLLAKR